MARGPKLLHWGVAALLLIGAMMFVPIFATFV